MINASLTLDSRALTAALGKMMAQSKRDLPVVLREVARNITKRAIALTPPSNGSTEGTAAKRLGEAAIEADARRLFWPMTDRQLSDYIGFHGGQIVSRQFGHKGAAALGDVSSYVLRRGEMERFHQQRRRKDGRVMQIHRDATTGLRRRDLKGLDTGIVRLADFNDFLKEMKGRVGILASGWNRAAAELGVRGVPAWITRHGTSYGGVSIRLGASEMSIEITNGTRFAGNVRGLERRIQRAVDSQAQAMERRVAAGVAAAARKAGF